MVSTIRYSANASSDHHPNQVPGILIIMNPKHPNLPKIIPFRMLDYWGFVLF